MEHNRAARCYDFPRLFVRRLCVCVDSFFLLAALYKGVPGWNGMDSRTVSNILNLLLPLHLHQHHHHHDHRAYAHAHHSCFCAITPPTGRRKQERDAEEENVLVFSPFFRFSSHPEGTFQLPSGLVWPEGQATKKVRYISFCAM